MKKYIIAIDQSTSASKAFLIGEKGQILRRVSKAHRQYYPNPGWAEHDAEEIWQNVLSGIREAAQGIAPEEIAALSICNQRETTVFWDKATGKPLRKAIVWQDVRAGELCAELNAHADRIRKVTGLELSPYYPAGKAVHALREDAALSQKAACGEALIGTVDSYLIYRLTNGKSFFTDVTNASRTQLFDIEKLRYDADICAAFGIPVQCLATVLPSDGDFGTVDSAYLPGDIPITGVMGDSHASLFAQGCVLPGMVKTSYGTGSSVMMNTGKKRIQAKGLSASIAYGCGGEVNYVLEGNITHSGDTLRWLCNEAQMASSPAEAEKIAASVPDCGGVYLVPAFSGMGAPYFDSQARAAFVGLSRSSTRAHMVRAAVESMAYQNADVILHMLSSAQCDLPRLNADGGGCKNALLMQLQADLLQCPVSASSETELSALGSAIMAAEKCGLFTKEEALTGEKRIYEPAITAAERDRSMHLLRDAVNRVLSDR
ncbi:MAG: glycerol kinase [Clostridia bacterium]|nr:glycerol kinase [Clostridia bacterium]